MKRNLAIVLGLLLLAACSDSGNKEAPPATNTTPPATNTTPPATNTTPPATNTTNTTQ
jgi:hypothetical protein